MMDRGVSNRTSSAGRGAIFSLVILSIFISTLFAREVGKFSYRGAPEEIDNDTIVVSDTMVAMSEKVYVRNQFYTDTISDTPSIMFVIDNSGSMGGTVSLATATDQLGNRFTVTRAFIDTVFRKYPTAEIGVTVFGSYLYFDPNDQPFFVRCAAQTNGAYIPLLRLDSTYTAYGSRTGYQVLQDILDTALYTTTGQNPNYPYVSLNYRPTNNTLRGTGTNINAGFDAVRCAMANTTRIKEGQFVIFLSDGEANAPYSSTDPRNLIFAGAANCPTTFTVYFTRDTVNFTVPRSIDSLTRSCRANGYSTSNPRSNAWPFKNNDFNTLMTFLKDSVYSKINIPRPATPRSITIGGQTNPSWVDSSFTFGKIFPLMGQITPFNFIIRYGRSRGDTLHNINFGVRTQAGVNLPRTKYEIKLWDRDLVFRYGGAQIVTGTEAMDSIEIYFPWNGGTAGYSYSAVQADLSTTAPPGDRELVTLVPGTGFFSAKFKRATSAARTAGNKVLEHAQDNDTIIAVFRNREDPVLPLDTLRVFLPLRITPLCGIDSAVTRDADANGYIDRIDLYLDRSINLTPDLARNFTVRCNGLVFTDTSIIRISDRVFGLMLQEQVTPSLQTSWLPTVSSTLVPGMAPLSNYPCKDGCAPVIQRVIKYVNGEQRINDTVHVFLSEKFFAASGGTFSLMNAPQQTFFTWWSSNGLAFTSADSLLAGIANFTKVLGDSILIFAMSNNRDLTDEHWLSLRSTSLLMRDQRGNYQTNSENRKVRVEIIINKIPIIVNIFPNPSGPTIRRVETGPLILENEQSNFDPRNSIFKDWVRQDHAGTVISLGMVTMPPFNVTTGKREKVQAWVKIYDVVGNPVNWRKVDDLFVNMTNVGPVAKEINFYWNGLNFQGMKAAPAVYRATIYIDYPAATKIQDLKVNKNLGITR